LSCFTGSLAMVDYTTIGFVLSGLYKQKY
jgi:hypothetical protein